MMALMKEFLSHLWKQWLELCYYDQNGGIPELRKGWNFVEPKNPTQLASCYKNSHCDERFREETGKATLLKWLENLHLMVSSRLAEKMLFENQIKQRDLDRRTEGTYASCH